MTAYRLPAIGWIARLRLIVGPDRYGAPTAEVCLGCPEAPDDLIGATYLVLTWGNYSVPPQLGREGGAIGRLWVEWPWLGRRLVLYREDKP